MLKQGGNDKQFFRFLFPNHIHIFEKLIENDLV